MQTLTLTPSIIPELWTVFIAMLPLIELRGAIPIAINVYKMQPGLALLLGIVGSLLPAIPILYFLKWLEPYLKKVPELAKLMDNVYTRTRKKGKLVQDYEVLGLILFIGIPLPGTGVWTGMLAAYIFDLPKKLSLLAALFGTTLAGTIMVFLSDFQNAFSVIGSLLFIFFAGLAIKYGLKGTNET